MRRARSGPVALLAVAVAAGGCAARPAAAPRPAVAPPRTVTLDEVLAAYDGFCNELASLSASGDLDLRDQRAGKSQKLGVRLVAARGGRLYLKGSVAVITALEVVADGQRFWLQVPSKKTVWTGLATGAAERDAGTEQAPYYALRPGDVAAALLPEPLAPKEREGLVFEADATSVSLTLVELGPDGRGSARRRVSLARDSLRPLRLRGFDARGEVVSDVRLSGWQDGLPRLVQLDRPAEGYQASFSFTRLEPNPTVPERAFVPRTPDGYRVVEVR